MITVTVEFLAFFIALFRYKRLKISFIVWFIPFLLFTAICELTSEILYSGFNLATEWIYNIIIPLSQFFYYFIFYKLINNEAFKKYFIILTILYSLVCIYYLKDFKSFNIEILLFGAITLIVLSCYYFYSCLLYDLDINNAEIKAGLWIASGILIFYSGIVIVFSLFDYIRINKIMISGSYLFNIVPRYLSLILYTCFSVAFLLWKKPQKI